MRFRQFLFNYLKSHTIQSIPQSNLGSSLSLPTCTQPQTPAGRQSKKYMPQSTPLSHYGYQNPIDAIFSSSDSRRDRVRFTVVLRTRRRRRPQLNRATACRPFIAHARAPLCSPVAANPANPSSACPSPPLPLSPNQARAPARLCVCVCACVRQNCPQQQQHAASASVR